MDFNALINQMTPSVYEKLKQAVEIGKWPNGELLTKEQKASCLEAVIAWDVKHKPEDQRVGYIDTRPHAHCGGDGEVVQPASEETALNWKH